MGLKSQLGLAVEPSYGTLTTPTRFLEFTKESLERRNRTLESNALRGSGRKLRRSNRRAVTGYDGGGDLSIEVGPDNVGVLFEHALGAVSTDAANAPDAYVHTFTLGDQRGKSLSIQKGVEQDDGTVVPFTFVGCKFTDVRLRINVDGYLELDLTVDARDVDVTEPLAPLTLPNGFVFDFRVATLSLGGSTVAQVRTAEVQLQNNLKTDRYYLGQGGLKSEPRQDGWPMVTGTVEADFVDRATMFDAYAADTPLALVLEFTGEDLGDPAVDVSGLKVTVPEVKLNGGTPTVSGPQVPTVSVPWEGFDDGVAEGITVELVNGDAAP